MAIFIHLERNVRSEVCHVTSRSVSLRAVLRLLRYTVSSCLTANSKLCCAKLPREQFPRFYRRIRSFLPQLSAQECANCFRHAGYASI